MSTNTKTKNELAIEEAVKGYYSDNDLDKAAKTLLANGVAFSSIEVAIKSTGVLLGFVLTDNQFSKKVGSLLKNKTKPSSFFGVVELTKGLDIPQRDFKEILAQVQNHFKTSFKADSFTTRLVNPNTKLGTICEWVVSHPDCSPEEILNSSVGDLNYRREVAAWVAFCGSLQSTGK